MRALSLALCATIVAAGCKSGGGGGTETAAKAPAKAKRPRTATLYVESKGEPVNAGDKKVEVADAEGKPTSSFGAKDLLVPGMTLLVTGATIAGGAILVRALDKKDKPDGATVVAGGGSEGTYVSVPAAPKEEAALAAPDPAALSGVATEGETSSVLVAAGTGVVSTPTSVLMSMGYAAEYSGPSYIKMKGEYLGTLWEGRLFVLVYSWTLSLDRSAVKSGETVDVFVTFVGLSAGTLVDVRFYIPNGAKLVVEHTPLYAGVPPSGPLEPGWILWEGAGSGGTTHARLIMTFPGGSAPIKIGHLVVTTPVEVSAESGPVGPAELKSKVDLAPK